MNFIKLTRVLDPHNVSIGYYGGLAYVPSPYAPASQSYGITSGSLSALGALPLYGQQQQQLTQSQLAGQALSQLSQQQLYSQGQQLQPLQAPQYPPLEVQEMYIPVDSINYMINVKHQNYATSLFLLNNNDSFFIKESPEQIMKIIHDLGFNKKMDEILSE